MLKKIFHFVGADLRKARYFDAEHNTLHYHIYCVHNVTFFVCFFWILALLADINLQHSAFCMGFYEAVFPDTITEQYIQENQMKVVFWLFFPVSIFLSFLGAFYFFTPHFQGLCRGKEISTKIGRSIFFAGCYFIGGLLLVLAILWGGYIILFGLISALGPHQHWLVMMLQTLVMAKIYGLFSSSTSSFVQLFLFFKPLAPKA